MKKILMGTSALAVAVAIGSPAKAATWDLDWGGYFEAAVAYRDSDSYDDRIIRDANDNVLGTADVGDGIDVISDSEIIFTPSIVLDNGLTFGVNVQLEANSNAESDIIDESYAFVRGSFGQVRLGSTDAAQAAMLSNAPDVSWIGASSGSLAGILSIPEFTGTYGQPGGGDAAKIIYFTPRFSGFQLGASYAHDGSEDKRAPNSGNFGGGGDDPEDGFEDQFSIAANYINSFGAFDVALSAGYTTASSVVGDADPDSYAVSLTLGYAGFKIGGSYANNDGDTGSNADESDFFDLGVSYETGPWGASLQYSHGENDADAETDQYLGAVSYKLGPGVTAGAFIGYADHDTGSSDVDGFIVGTGFKLSF